MKRFTYLLIILLMVFSLVSGCQPTPNQELIQNRTEEGLDTAISASAEESGPYQAPDQWSETFTVRGQVVRIDTKIEVANEKEQAVLTINQKEFDVQQAIDYLTAIYGKGCELRQSLYSYDEILTDLQNVMKGALVEIDDDTGEQIWEPYEGQQEEIDRLQQLLAESSPDDNYISLTKENLAFPVSDRVIRAPNGNDIYMICNASSLNLRRYRSCNIQLENWVMQGDAIPEERGHTLENIKISEQQAAAIGDQILSALNLENDMVIAATQKARATESYTYRILGEGYLLTYVSCANGCMPFCYEQYSDSSSFYFPQDEEEYAARWPQERIEIFVTDEGAITFSWTYPKEVVRIDNANVKLLPFAQLQECIKKLISFGISGRNSGEADMGEILITRMVLGAAIQRIPDQNDEAYLIPTWMIEVTTELENRENIDPSILMVSALDGAYVNRWG